MSNGLIIKDEMKIFAFFLLPDYLLFYEFVSCNHYTHNVNCPLADDLIQYNLISSHTSVQIGNSHQYFQSFFTSIHVFEFDMKYKWWWKWIKHRNFLNYCFWLDWNEIFKSVQDSNLERKHEKVKFLTCCSWNFR